MSKPSHGDPRVRKLVILGFFMVALLFPLLALNDVGMGHRGGEMGSYELGCGDSEGKLGCHGKMPSSDIAGDLDFPYEYDRGGEYTLGIKITGDPQETDSGPEGGFDLKVSHGSLEELPGKDDVEVNGQEATHTEAGSYQHIWYVKWIAPTGSDPDVTFWLSVNAVDGDNGVGGDQWVQFVSKSTSSGEDLQPEGGGSGSSPTDQVIEEEDVSLLYRPIIYGTVVGAVILMTTIYLVQRYADLEMGARRRERSAMEQKASQSRMVECPECGSEVRASRLDSHIKNVHGRGE